MEQGDRRFRRARTALWRHVGDEVLVGLPTGDGFEVLADTAGHIWHLLADQPTLEQLTDILDGSYDGPREVIASDVATLLEELQRRGLVEKLAGRGG